MGINETTTNLSATLHIPPCLLSSYVAFSLTFPHHIHTVCISLVSSIFPSIPLFASFSPPSSLLPPLCSSYIPFWLPLPLCCSIPVSPARVFIFARPAAECLTRWKKLGVKRQHCCQLGSLSPSVFCSLSLSFSLFLTVDIFQLMYSWPLLPQWSINKNYCLHS